MKRRRSWCPSAGQAIMVQGLLVLTILLAQVRPTGSFAPAGLGVKSCPQQQVLSDCHHRWSRPLDSYVERRGAQDNSVDAPGLPPMRVQTLDYTTLALLSRELSTILVPSRLEQIMQPDDFTLLLHIRTFDSLRWLLISWQPESARISLIADPPFQGKGKGGGAKGPSFYSLPSTLKSFLQLKMLIRVSMPLPGERITVFDFAERATDTEATLQLYVEIMGRRSNVMLVNPADKTVLACGYQVSPSKSVRSISVGQPYSLPPALLTPMPSLSETTEEAFCQQVGLIPSHTLRKALLSAYRGFSPQLIDTMASAVGLNSSTTIEDIGEGGLQRLFQGPVKSWLGVLEGEKAQQGGLAADLSSYTPILFPPPQQEEGPASKHALFQPVDSINELVQRYYTSCLRRREFMELQQRSLTRIQTVLSRLLRTRKEFADQLEEAGEENLASLQTRADLLTTYAYSWKDGDRELQCYDFETGEPIMLPLADGRSAADEAQVAYKRIRKLKRSIDAVKPLLEQMDLKVAYVEEVETSVLQLGGGGSSSSSSSSSSLEADLQVLREIAEELALNDRISDSRGSTFFSTILTRGMMGQDGVVAGGGGGGGDSSSSGSKKKKAAGGGKKAASGKKGGGQTQQQQQPQQGGGNNIPSFRRRVAGGSSSSNCLVYVGRNSRQNDHITFSMAKPTDLWFHARGVPGSHCLLRCDDADVVEEEDLQFAADLAAFFSKGRGSKDVPVQWTYRKHLKRVPGGGPGMVQVLKENKVVWGRPERGQQIVEAIEEDVAPTVA